MKPEPLLSTPTNTSLALSTPGTARPPSVPVRVPWHRVGSAVEAGEAQAWPGGSRAWIPLGLEGTSEGPEPRWVGLPGPRSGPPF